MVEEIFVPLLIHSNIHVVALTNASLTRQVPSLVTWSLVIFSHLISYPVFSFVEGYVYFISKVCQAMLDWNQ